MLRSKPHQILPCYILISSQAQFRSMPFTCKGIALVEDLKGPESQKGGGHSQQGTAALRHCCTSAERISQNAGLRYDNGPRPRGGYALPTPAPNFLILSSLRFVHCTSIFPQNSCMQQDIKPSRAKQNTFQGLGVGGTRGHKHACPYANVPAPHTHTHAHACAPQMHTFSDSHTIGGKAVPGGRGLQKQETREGRSAESFCRRRPGRRGSALRLSLAPPIALPFCSEPVASTIQHGYFRQT